MIKMEIIKLTLDDGIALLLILFYGGYIPRSYVFYMALEHEDNHI